MRSMASLQGSEATTAKTGSTKSKPWKEVNDEIAARMMAASSDSPPLIPKRGYEDGANFTHRKAVNIKPKSPTSYNNTTSECSSTDDCKNLIDSYRKTPSDHQHHQVTLYKGHHLGHPDAGFFDGPPMAGPYGAGSDALPHQVIPPHFPHTMAPFGPPPAMPPFGDDGIGRPTASYPEFCVEGAPFPPQVGPPFGYPPFMQPPIMHPLDFEAFTYDKQKKANKKRRMKRRSHSVDFLPASLPGPFFGPPPPPHLMLMQAPHDHNMFGGGYPPMMGPQQPFFGCGPMGGHQLAIEMPQTFDQAPDMPPPSVPVPYPQLLCSNDFADVPPATNFPQMGNGHDTKFRQRHQYDEENFNASKHKSEKNSNSDDKVDYVACCKNFSQILWIILGIMLIGLILGLILGLTLV